MPQATKKLDQLTTTRFIAALSVVLFHSGRTLGFIRFFPMLTSGPTAVDYFFVLSGFVMSLAYYRPGTRFDFRGYWLARFSRIYPVYIFSFVITCFYYLNILSKIKPDKISANIFLYQAWIPDYALSFNIAAWSLSVETFFYLVFPFLIILSMRLSAEKMIWAATVFWVISQVVHSILFIRFMPEWANWLNYFPLFHLNAFLLGVAGGILYLTNSSLQTIKQSTIRLALAASVGVILLLLSLREYMPTFPHSFSLDTGLLAPLFLIIVMALALDTTYLSQVLSHPRLVLLGDASYALYILHVPFLWLLKGLLTLTGVTIAYGIVFSIYIPATILLCIVVFKYLERPARDWLRANATMLPLILLDVVFVLVAIRLSFVVRLGDSSTNFLWTQRFALRVGVAGFFLCLLIFQMYSAPSWQSLVRAVLSGAVILTAFMYLAWIERWVEGFPKSIILIIPVFVFISLYLSRQLIPFLRLRLLNAFS